MSGTTIEDMKIIGDAAAEAAKVNIRDSGALIPVLMLVTQGEVTDVIGIPDIPTGLDKRAAYRMLAFAIHKKNPDAAIMINDSYMKMMKTEEMDSYKAGNLAVDPVATECIIVAFKGPHIEPYVRVAPYHRDPHGEIVFHESNRLVRWRQDEPAAGLVGGMRYVYSLVQ